MLTPSNRPRGTGSLSSTLGRLDETDELLSRRMSRRQKVPDPVAPASGGVTGVTRLTAGGLTQANAEWPSGSSLTFNGYESARLFGTTDVDISEGSDGNLELATAGFYEFRAYVRLAFSGSIADFDQVRVSADWQLPDHPDPYPFWLERIGSSNGLPSGGSPSLRGVYSWGPVYVPDGGGSVWFGLNWMAANTAYLSAMALDVWKVG